MIEDQRAVAVTIRFHSTGIVPGQARPVSLIGRSLTIGRGGDNDLVLPDPDMWIARHHCSIENHDGKIIVIDFSRSGTFLNHGEVALGKVAHPLVNGDILSIGGYDLLVEITLAEGSPSFGRVVTGSDPTDDPLDSTTTEPMRKEAASPSPHTPEVADHIPSDAPMPAPVPAPGKVIPYFDDIFRPQPGAAPISRRYADMSDRPSAFEASLKEKPTPRWRRGNALFRIPRTMWTETAELAELRLSPNDTLTVEMRALLERSMVGRGTRTDEHAVARLGTRMKATLHADARDIEVTILGTDVQILEDDAALGWDWRVIPLREGSTLVTLRLTMLADLDGRETAVDAQALHTSVEITVRTFMTRPHRFIRDNWRWMLGSSGIGAIAAVWALLGS